MIRRLRERSEPVRLFGESDYDAYQRLKKLEILEPEIKVCVCDAYQPTDYRVNTTGIFLTVWHL